MKIPGQEGKRFGRSRSPFYPVERRLLLLRADLEGEEGGPFQFILKIKMSSLSHKSCCRSMSSSTQEVTEEDTKQDFPHAEKLFWILNSFQLLRFDDSEGYFIVPNSNDFSLI